LRKFTLNKDFKTSAKKKPNPRKTIKKVKADEIKEDANKIENEVKV